MFFATFLALFVASTLAVIPLDVNPLAVNPLAVNPLAVNPLGTVHQIKKQLETVDQVERHYPKNQISSFDAFVSKHFDDDMKFEKVYTFGPKLNGRRQSKI